MPRTVTAMAHDALRFIDALELREIDVLGYSLGGYVAQELVLIRPRLVRRLVLAGTGPQGGEDMHGFSDEMFVHANRDQPGAEDVLALFFERSETSVRQGKGVPEAHLHPHAADRDTRTTLEVRDAQLDAITAWGAPDASVLNRLAGITQPVLVANGDNDRLRPDEELSTACSPSACRTPGSRSTRMLGTSFLFQYPGPSFAGEVEQLPEARARRSESAQGRPAGKESGDDEHELARATATARAAELPVQAAVEPVGQHDLALEVN